MEQSRHAGTNQKYLELVKEMIAELKYGQIIITVQDEKIVQVEQNKKIRLNN